MPNYFNIPFANPFKFVPDTDSPGIHFDDAWACKQIKPFELKVRYRQKWQRGDTTQLQTESSVLPEPVKVIDINGQVLKQFPWVVAFAYVYYNVYEINFTIDDLPSGIYFLTTGTSFGMYISEPIDFKDKWPGTLFFKYSNSYNDWGVAFTTGIRFGFRCEGAIMDMQPERIRAVNISQTRNITTTSATPYRTFKLYIGDLKGVFPYVVDILNRIFCCDYIDIEGKLYESEPESKWEVTRVKGYPLVGAALDVSYKFNNMGAQANEGLATTGVVVAYNIETAFFGPGAIVPVTDIENQG